METIATGTERSQIEVTRAELLIINAALNEVCNGIDIFEFETRIGTTRERVAVLLKEVGTLLDKIELLHMQS